MSATLCRLRFEIRKKFSYFVANTFYIFVFKEEVVSIRRRMDAIQASRLSIQDRLTFSVLQDQINTFVVGYQWKELSIAVYFNMHYFV